MTEAFWKAMAKSVATPTDAPTRQEVEDLSQRLSRLETSMALTAATSLALLNHHKEYLHFLSRETPERDLYGEFLTWYLGRLQQDEARRR